MACHEAVEWSAARLWNGLPQGCVEWSAARLWNGLPQGCGMVCRKAVEWSAARLWNGLPQGTGRRSIFNIIIISIFAVLRKMQMKVGFEGNA
jgi:hypothetical protein